ncbi:MAG: hypothetical protein ACFFDN_31325 [Candidatus Hodarchaeota archaeon]
MDSRNWNSWGYISIIIGSVQFIVLTSIAMVFYKGGTYIDSSTSHYLFSYNYFSDLGRTIAHSGVQNMISFILFTVTLALWGISHILFYIVFLKFFSNSKKLKRLSIAGSTFGIITGVFYVGIAFTPVNILGFIHDIFVGLSFGSILLCLILYSLVIFQEKKYPNFYAKTLAISVIIIVTYYLTSFLVQTSNDVIRLLLAVIGQKVMIYTLLVCNILQGYGALRQRAS